jgi:arylsulfatase A-like enzyme
MHAGLMASRASLFTGRYPTTVRVRGMGMLPPVEITLPEVLRRHGYATGAFGKVHFTPEQYTHGHLKSDVPILDWRRFAEAAQLPLDMGSACGNDYGFQVHVGCDDACQGNFREWLRREAPELAERRPDRLSPDGPADLWVSPYPSAFHQSTYIASQAEAFIRSQSKGKPWFALCSFVAPHHPFEAPADQIARYPLEAVPPPERRGGVDASRIPAPASDAVGEMDRFGEDVQRRIVQHYLASISLVDDGVGRLIDALRQTGQLDDTVVVFAADHGEFLGNHGLLRKPSLHYDETLRVPLLLKGPGLPARRVDGLVELVDVYPTLLGLLGIDINAGVQGRDWSAQLRNGGEVARDDTYTDMFDLNPMVVGRSNGPYMACVTLRSPRWKLSIYPTAGPQFGQ